MDYPLSIGLTKFEFHLIQEIRKLQSTGYGDLSIKFVDGKCVDLRSSPTTKPSLLKDLQKDIDNNKKML